MVIVVVIVSRLFLKFQWYLKLSLYHHHGGTSATVKLCSVAA